MLWFSYLIISFFIIVRNEVNINKNYNQLDFNDNDNADDENEEEIFYTPPSSPSLLIDDDTNDSEDEFNDTELPKYDVFIEG